MSSTNHLDLGDFEYIEHFVTVDFDSSSGRMSHHEGDQKINMADDEPENQSAIHKFVEGTYFSLLIAVAILSNAIITTVEQETRADDDQGTHWLVIEITFTVIFLFECLLKLTD